MARTLRQLTRQDVRRLAITRQHLSDTTTPVLLDLVKDLGCLQLDPITAVERSHLLVLWSRLGRVDEAHLDTLLWEDRALFEYWAHAASIVPTHDYPVHHWNMRQTRAGDETWRASLREKGIEGIDAYVLDVLKQNGPMLSRDIEDNTARYHSRWWSGRQVPRVLQHLWTRGDVMIVGRDGKQRLWGLSESFLPPETDHSIWDEDQITRYAAQRAIRALGAATPKQIKYHYTRGRYPKLTAVLNDLVTEGLLEQVDVNEKGEVLPGDWYLHRKDVPLIKALQNGEFQPRTTLVSPFDNLICDRDRTELLWDFHFRIEIYVPKSQRQYGYYVMPILHEDLLVGRIDPKYDRKSEMLHIQHVYREPGSPRNKRMLVKIRRAVESLAGFLGAKYIDWGHVPDEWITLKP